jgi:hypothetical protein
VISVSIICINGHTERGGAGNDSGTGKPWVRGCETEVKQGRRGGKDHGVSTSKIHFNLDTKEYVDHLYKLSLREVERWVLSATPCQPKEKKKHHGTIRDMIVASSHVLSSSLEEGSQWVYSVGLLFFPARTNKRPHHRKIFLQENAFLKGCEQMD